MTKGYLHIITTPVKGDIFVDEEYRGTGDVNIELDAGTYLVNFGRVIGYTTPASLTITINPNFVTLVTIEYTR